MSVQYMITEETLVFFDTNYVPHHVNVNAPQFDDIVAELRKPNPDVTVLVELADLSKAVQAQVNEAFAAAPKSGGTDYLQKGVIEVTRAGVTYNGEPVHGILVDRMMAVLNAGLPIAGWVKFAENLFMNPAEWSRDELYLWLETSDLPITSDGHFLAYKRVNNDYTDIYTGKVDNSVGQLVSLPGGRGAVDEDRDRTCSHGLHFCSKEYLPSFGVGGGNRVVVVKINPADVVSIPSDYNNTKGRTWRYEVVDEINPQFVNEMLWPVVTDDYESEENDEDDDYDYVDPYEDDDYEEDDYNDEDDYEGTNALVGVPAWRTAADDLVDQFGIVALRNLASKYREGSSRTSAWIWKEASKEDLAAFVAQRRAGLTV